MAKAGLDVHATQTDRALAEEDPRLSRPSRPVYRVARLLEQQREDEIVPPEADR